MHDHHGWLGAGLALAALIAVLFAAGYLVAAARAGPRGWSGWRVAAWLAGCLVLAVALAPVLPWEGDPRHHMARHLLLGMVAPLGLVLAAPVTLLLRTAPVRWRRVVGAVLRSRVVHVVGHPAVAAVLSVGGMYVALLLPLPAHPLLDLHYVLAGYLFAWSVAGPDPAPGRPGLATRVTVLVLAATAHGVLAKLRYAEATSAADRDAALLMYYGGDVAELLLAVALFAAWYRGTSGFGRRSWVSGGHGRLSRDLPPRPARDGRRVA